MELSSRLSLLHRDHKVTVRTPDAGWWAIPHPAPLQPHLLRGTTWSVSLSSFSIKLSNTFHVVDNPLKWCMFISMLI